MQNVLPLFQEAVASAFSMRVHYQAPSNDSIAGSTTEHNAFTLILRNSTDTVNFCPLNSHSVAKQFTSSLDYVISVSICFGCYFAAALILYSTRIFVCNRHICSHAYPGQLTSGVLNFAVWILLFVGEVAAFQDLNDVLSSGC